MKAPAVPRAKTQRATRGFRRSILSTTGAKNVLLAGITAVLIAALSRAAFVQEPHGDPWEPTRSLTEFGAWVSPIERNAFLRLPAMTIDLSAIAVAADGQRAWAVGDGGTIVATRDGGSTWQAQTSGTKGFLASVAVTGDGQRAWAVSWYGTIVATRDGGSTWQAQTSGTKSQTPP